MPPPRPWAGCDPPASHRPPGLVRGRGGSGGLGQVCARWWAAVWRGRGPSGAACLLRTRPSRDRARPAASVCPGRPGDAAGRRPLHRPRGHPMRGAAGAGRVCRLVGRAGTVVPGHSRGRRLSAGFTHTDRYGVMDPRVGVGGGVWGGKFSAGQLRAAVVVPLPAACRWSQFRRSAGPGRHGPAVSGLLVPCQLMFCAVATSSAASRWGAGPARAGGASGPRHGQPPARPVRCAAHRSGPALLDGHP